MQPIVIEKLNEVFLRINCNLEQALEFKEFTSCFANNYFFHPKFRSHMWNGKISFYNMRDMTLPVGLLPQFFKFCEQFDYQYQFNFDKTELFNNITDNEVDDFYKAIFKSTEYWPRDYQDESVRKALRNKRGVVVLPTASGKSLVIYCLIRFLLAQDKKILLVVPSINLTNQMFGDFSDYGFDAKQYCSVLYGTSKTYREMQENEYCIELENGQFFTLHGNQLMKILNTNNMKRICDLEEGEDIDYEWARNFYQKQIS